MIPGRSNGDYRNSLLDSTVRYLGIEIEDALEMSEQIDV
tara:strand:+ start:93 stop:209 length:117 start_codon:yes stop_codon:yes gene_type:complete